MFQRFLRFFIPEKYRKLKLRIFNVVSQQTAWHFAKTEIFRELPIANFSLSPSFFGQTRCLSIPPMSTGHFPIKNIGMQK